MIGIPTSKWLKMTDTDLKAMRLNYAETKSLSVERIGWKQRRKIGESGTRMFLFVKPKKETP